MSLRSHGEKEEVGKEGEKRGGQKKGRRETVGRSKRRKVKSHGFKREVRKGEERKGGTYNKSKWKRHITGDMEGKG